MGLIEPDTERTFLFEATPDIVTQMKLLTRLNSNSEKEMADGIFITHGHIGHYTGLMYLGKEATDAKAVPVYAMPRMREYLTTSGPWSQLVKRENIALRTMSAEKKVILSDKLQVTPFLVPHRDEYSETVGFHIQGPQKSALFIPDIDKWERWDRNIVEELSKVDYAFLDATFYSGKEINNRDITQIPHPFIIESMKTFKHLPLKEKNKIVFIHLNHTNPVLNENSVEAKKVLEAGYRIGKTGEIFEL